MSKPKALGDQLVHALQHFGVDAVIDVGANKGQYGKKLRKHGYGGPIHSFEPLPDVHEILSATAEDDSLWFVPDAVAVGDFTGEIELARSNESDMSSILPQSALQKQVSPSSAVSELLLVPMERLDQLVERSKIGGDELFIKLDVQGFEPKVLAGMDGIWPRVRGLQLEMSLVELYEGETPWRKMIDMMEVRGYFLSLLLPGYYERKLGRQLQVDGVFFKS